MVARRGCALALLTLLQQPPLGAPQQQAAELCHIADLFSHLTAITTDEECLAGRDGGRGPPPSSESGAPPWYPSSMDDCNAMCGVVFEPFCASKNSTRPPARSIRLSSDTTAGAQGTSAATC